MRRWLKQWRWGFIGAWIVLLVYSATVYFAIEGQPIAVAHQL
ncbi:hypothetical protein [Paenibacillus sp. L3-i20]|nr:hypothetical protein [Paenibacillus sp. L3-i20]